MAIDLVKALKYETPEGGTESDLYETEVNINEDFLQAKGFAIDENTYINKNVGNNELQFTDINGTKKLSELGGSNISKEFVIAMSIVLG